MRHGLTLHCWLTLPGTPAPDVTEYIREGHRERERERVRMGGTCACVRACVRVCVCVCVCTRFSVVIIIIT